VTERHVRSLICVYDPENTYSGSRLYSYDFSLTLSRGYFPAGSIWFRWPQGDLTVIRNARPGSFPMGQSGRYLPLVPKRTCAACLFLRGD